MRPKIVVERMAIIEEELAKRKTNLQLERELSTLWECPASEVRELIKAVYARWAEEAQNESREERRNGIKNALNALYARALEAGDLKVARSVLDDLVRLDGLAETNELRPIPILLTQGSAASPLDIRNQIRALEAAKSAPTLAPEIIDVDEE